MKHHCIISCIIALTLLLTACGMQNVPAPAAPPTEEPAAPPAQEETAHKPSQGGNVTDHEPAGYCGNTVTTVSRRDDEEPASFWGDDSVALTDLLVYLDYSENLCRCPTEYTVDTEFGTGYGVNLTEGFVRYGGGQTQLTEEQASLIREILERVESGE